MYAFERIAKTHSVFLWWPEWVQIMLSGSCDPNYEATYIENLETSPSLTVLKQPTALLRPCIIVTIAYEGKL